MRRVHDIFDFRAGGSALLALAVACAALLALPAFALASPEAVIRDCAQDGKLDHHYSLSDLKNAAKKLPTDVDEYTNCRDVINQAEVAGSGANAHGSSHGGGPGGSGGNTGSGGTSANAGRDLANAQRAGGKPPTLSLGGQKVVPGSGGVFKTAGAANGMPLPVLLALIGLGAVTAAGGFVALRRRFPEVVGAAIRIFRR